MDTNPITRLFEFVRYFEVAHTLAEACERFQISKRTFVRYRAALELAGIEIPCIERNEGLNSLYRSKVVLQFIER